MSYTNGKEMNNNSVDTFIKELLNEKYVAETKYYTSTYEEGAYDIVRDSLESIQSDVADILEAIATLKRHSKEFNTLHEKYITYEN